MISRRQDGGGQRGAVAIEFAFVFPLLFLLLYGIVVYSYVFVLNSALHHAAQAAAESAVSIDPAAPNATELRDARARATARASLDWLPSHQRARVVGEEGERADVRFCPGAGGTACPPDIGGATGAIVVILVMPITEPALFPRLTLPLVGAVPPLPDQLRAQAVARI